MDLGVTLGLLVATFTASFVEFVEALTIVLAMGATRSWRSALSGVAAAVAALAAADSGTRLGLDWFSFVVSFKGVFLEGVEVVFIVITFGLNAGNVPVAAVGAAVAGVAVIALGAAAHRPLARVPENTLKYGVGLMLASFGTFWSVEGLGIVRG